MKQYMVLSYFDMNDPHFPGYKNLCWKEHFTGTEGECVEYCEKHSIHSSASWYIFLAGEYPIGYYKERNISIKKNYRLFINGNEIK